jgi:PPOX class probable F420-dependent enzyme
MLHLDPQNAYHARVRHRLRHDLILWLTTVGADGKPQPSPVWFLWDGQHTVRIYSRPGTAKLPNIESHPQVSLNFDSDERGGDIVVFTGIARTVVAETANLVPEYVEKYHAGILRIGMDHQSFGAAYDACIEVTLESLRGH